ncbi:hypothetical protein EV363DRAFT_1366693 [Boletus edulis]|uniref:Secreted protein n=1 Tax=Boletus edulis BED1 TaxID=1328754 RepID=A0AAD4BBM1_BOLED|nr:hypothetical protein EV363DRAFT_1366849 [Boletus edulis]KAF8121140.1 hypothetical protein EV363DRAFT_1366693 [Boletus edulis]KAF8415818.1 hypothetical protein L210DRAFT_3584544 [Boletus edulis BED1]
MFQFFVNLAVLSLSWLGSTQWSGNTATRLFRQSSSLPLPFSATSPCVYMDDEESVCSYALFASFSQEDAASTSRSLAASHLVFSKVKSVKPEEEDNVGVLAQCRFQS